MNNTPTPETTTEAILEGYIEAYWAEHGKRPDLVTDGEWVKLDGNNYRIADLPEMTRVLRERRATPEADVIPEPHVFQP